MWRWLSLRFGEEHFPGQEASQEIAARMVGLMDLGLQAISERQVTRYDFSLSYVTGA